MFSFQLQPKSPCQLLPLLHQLQHLHSHQGVIPCLKGALEVAGEEQVAAAKGFHRKIQYQPFAACRFINRVSPWRLLL